MHATSSPKAVNFQPAILAALAAALFIAGIALGSVVDVRLASAPAAAPAPDTSYNAVEGSSRPVRRRADTSYNTVEELRGQVRRHRDDRLRRPSRRPREGGRSRCCGQDPTCRGHDR